MQEESIIRLVGSLPGPTTTIMVGVHGNELSGVIALQQLLDKGLHIRSGIVSVVFANLLALEQGMRLIDVNMNRCFGQQKKGYEADRVQKLLPYLQQSNYLLDLHNTIDLPAPPFLICEHSDLSSFFEVPYVVTGLDELHPGGSDGYMNSIGKKGVCLECGSIVDDLGETVPFAKCQIINFLYATGNMNGEVLSYSNQITMRCYDIYQTKTDYFHLVRPFSEFESVSRGQLIGMDGNMKVVAPTDGYILFARETKGVGEECFVLATNSM